MSSLDRLADTIAGMDRSAVRMLVGTVNGDGTVQIGGTAVTVTLWTGAATPGRKAVLLMQDGMSVGIGTDTAVEEAP